MFALYVNAFGKYALAFLIVLYTALVYLGILKKDGPILKVLYPLELFLVFLYHAAAFLCIYMQMDSLDYMIFYLFQLLILFTYVVLFFVIYPGIHPQILSSTCMLLAISMIILTRLNFERGKRQCFMIIVSAILSLFIPFLMGKLKEQARFELALGVIGVAALASVYLLGSYTGGSKLYIQLLGFNLQVSEFVKILYVFMLAGILSKRKDIAGVFLAGVIAAVHVMLLVFSRDLGSALILYLVFVLMVFVASGKWLYLPLGALILAGASYVAYFHFSHFRTRVMAFLNPWDVIDKEGYQITQSLFAISGGGLFGRGLFKGTSKSIPNVMTDFIFSAITEEMGLITAVCIILIYFALFLTILRLSVHLKTVYHKLITFGLGCLLAIQVFLIVGGDTRFLPMTGITLPLMSYGGNSVMATLFLFSVIQGLVLLDRKEETGIADKQQYKRYRRQNMGVAFTFMSLFLVMTGYIVWYAMTNEQVLMENDYNARTAVLAQENSRGRILSADGEVLAYSEEDGTRVYPFGNLFSHVVGYIQKGKSGIEDAMNYFLVSSDLSETEKLAYAKKGEKYPGDSVQTTLQTKVQETAEKALGAYKGAVIVTDPNTGEILAMVSRPDFDPNEIATIWDSITEEEDNSVLVNRVTQGSYPPGSTFKILTALEYIRENPTTYDAYSFDCHGSFTWENALIHCYHGMSHGKVDFTGSFAKSCNASFSNIGSTLDWNRFGTTLQSLLFNSDLPYDLPSVHSRVSATEDMAAYAKLQTSIGQGTTSMSPLHLNMITCAIANGGELMKPQLINKVTAENGNLVKKYEPESLGQLMTAEEADILTRLMQEVVESGTATKLSGHGYTAAGKTGSAEYNENADSHAWFTGFAPAEDPQVCVTIIVEGAGSGGDYAVPMARRIFDVCLE